MKLKSGLGASYTVRPGNGVGLFYSTGPTRGIITIQVTGNNIYCTGVRQITTMQ